VVRIIPVLYSLEMTSTPSTAKATYAHHRESFSPRWKGSVRLLVAVSHAEAWDTATRTDGISRR